MKYCTFKTEYGTTAFRLDCVVGWHLQNPSASGVLQVWLTNGKELSISGDQSNCVHAELEMLMKSTDAVGK